MRSPYLHRFYVKHPLPPSEHGYSTTPSIRKIRWTVERSSPVLLTDQINTSSKPTIALAKQCLTLFCGSIVARSSVDLRRSRMILLENEIAIEIRLVHNLTLCQVCRMRSPTETAPNSVVGPAPTPCVPPPLSFPTYPTLLYFLFF